MKILQFQPDMQLLSANQGRLTDIMKESLYGYNPDIFSLLDFDNDYIYADPLLYYYFLEQVPEKKISIPQIIAGYIKDKTEIIDVTVRSDPHGYVYLPGLGYCRHTADTTASLDYDAPGDTFLLNGAPVTFTPPQTLAVPGLQLGIHTSGCLHGHNITLHESPAITAAAHSDTLNTALLLMQQYVPAFLHTVTSVTRDLILFNSGSYNSFAGIGQHGAAFLNTENQTKSTLFFVDDIAHQCGHIIFNTLTLDTHEYLQIPKYTPLYELVPGSTDKRKVYGAFHGLFTYTCILHCLHTIYQEASLTSLLRHEMAGRFGFYLTKFSIDLRNLSHPGILTEKGRDVYDSFAAGYQVVKSLYADLCEGFDYSNQPYSFSYTDFAVLNPRKPQNTSI